MKSRKKKISLIITIWLIVIVVAACAATAVLSYLALSERAERQTEELVRQNVEDVSTDIDDLADEAILSYIDRFIETEYIYTANIDDPDPDRQKEHGRRGL